MSSTIIVLLILGLVTTRPSSAADCSIDPQNNCRVNCSGTILDISDLVPYPYNISTVPTVGNYFLYNPCKGMKCQTADEYLSAVCLSDSDGSSSCGQLIGSQVTWTMISTSPYEFTVQYDGGDCTGNDCKKSLITFMQSLQTDSESVSIEYKGLVSGYYNFEVTGQCIGQNSCDLTTPPPHHHTDITGIAGVVLIILFLLGVLTYFIVGALVMKFYKGAKGKDLIPNYGLWSELPLLIKDGCLFIIRPCKGSKKDYESI